VTNDNVISSANLFTQKSSPMRQSSRFGNS